MLTEIVAAPRAWHGPKLSPDRYLLPIPDACLRELDAVVAELRRGPVPTLLLEPAHFQLEACGRLMATARAHLDEGTGVVVLDRLPLDRMSASEAVDVYWLLANFLEPPVAQEWKGTVIYDVRHDGGAYGEDTRGALTPVSLEMHTDSSMGEAPPNYLGLLCLETAPALLERLYQVFYRDHQEYQAADAAATNFRPVFAWDGRLRTRFNARHTFRGYEKTGRVLDDAGREAVARMDAFLQDPAHRLDLWLERGQIQFLNNRFVVHGRTNYVDHDDPARHRHLVRLWLRAGDRRLFRG